MHMTNLRRTKREDGFTLTEVLVTVFLTAIVIAGVTAVMLTTRTSVDRFAETTATQGSLTNATTVMARELTVSPEFVRAEDYLVELINADKEHILYAYYDPSDPVINLSAGLDGKGPTAIPDIKQPSLIEMRTFAGEEHSVINVLVSGIDIDQENNGMPLFTYYDNENQVMETPVTSDLGKIRRVATRVVGVTEARANPLEVATSVAVKGRYKNLAQNEVNNPDAPVATVLTGRLPRPQQDATLDWAHVAGADSYVLYRNGAAIATLASSQDLTYVDKTRPWGSTQTYTVVAIGVSGNSPSSNAVALTVVPDRPAFINVNPAANCASYTVARGQSNCLAWTPRTGAKGYKVYRGGTLISTQTGTTFTDAGRAFGSTASYTVIAYNTGQHGSGGDSVTSAPVSLISPPVAPTLTGSHSNGDRILRWTPSANATGYELSRALPSVAVWTYGVVHSVDRVDTNAVAGTTFTYRARASNAAGFSPYSNTITLNPNPAAPTLKKQDYTTHPSTRDGNNYLYWDAVANATSYQWSRGNEKGTYPATPSTSITTTNLTDSSPWWGSDRRYGVRACNKTGCSGTAGAVAYQPPAPFAINSVTQVKRQGQNTTMGAQPERSLTSQSIRVGWSSASGAIGYMMYGQERSDYIAKNEARSYGGGTSRAIATQDIISGEEYLYWTRAYAANGLSRETELYRFQAAPAGIKRARVHAESTNGYHTRNVYTADLKGAIGSIDKVQSKHFILSNTTISKMDKEFSDWTSGAEYSDTWTKKNSSGSTYPEVTSSKVVGGVQVHRTVVTVRDNYSTGTSKPDAGSWGDKGYRDSGFQPVDGTSDGRVSWTTAISWRGVQTVAWSGNFSASGWIRVPNSGNNWPNGSGNYEEIESR